MKRKPDLMSKLESPEQQERQEQVGAQDVGLMWLSGKWTGSREPSKVETGGDEERKEAANW